MINISIAAARLDINSVYGSILFGKNTAGGLEPYRAYERMS